MLLKVIDQTKNLNKDRNDGIGEHYWKKGREIDYSYIFSFQYSDTHFEQIIVQCKKGMGPEIIGGDISDEDSLNTICDLKRFILETNFYDYDELLESLEETNYESLIIKKSAIIKSKALTMLRKIH